jgi:hypothetical protein
MLSLLHGAIVLYIIYRIIQSLIYCLIHSIFYTFIPHSIFDAVRPSASKLQASSKQAPRRLACCMHLVASCRDNLCDTRQSCLYDCHITCSHHQPYHMLSSPTISSIITHPTPQKVIAYGISRGRAGLGTSSNERPARPRYIPYAITFWGVTQMLTRRA